MVPEQSPGSQAGRPEPMSTQTKGGPGQVAPRAPLELRPNARQGCGFDPWSGHMQASANECLDEWNSKSRFLSLTLPLSRKLINLFKKKKKTKGNCLLLSITETLLCDVRIGKMLSVS